MANQSILVSWIGHADLLAMFDDLGDTGEELRKAANIGGKYGEKPGPLKTAVNEGMFNQVHLLSNYPDVVHKPFAKWLGSKPQIHSVELANPNDYEGIYRATNRILGEVTTKTARDQAKLCILLSPGTPAMTVVWVLLGTSRYPATFYTTYKGKLNETKIPADLLQEIAPDLIRDRDIYFQHLASRNPSEVEGFESIKGESKAIRLAVGRTQRIALRDVSVLLLGESGSGKELFARAIHNASPRKNGPFKAINCAALPLNLLESELFGHVKGAFTGAVKNRDGAFTRANGGTLFLDEIGECDPQLQSKLLRVLQPPDDKGPCHCEFTPVGGTNELTSNVRIVAATNRNLQKEIKAHRFREDLYYRIAVITLKLPPLRERRTDIPLLVAHFLNKINDNFSGRKRGYAPREPGYKDKTISASAIDFVKRYGWPGNVRQLHNILVQAAIMTANDIIDREDIKDALGEMEGDQAFNALEQPLGDGFDLDEHINSIHRHYLSRAMDEAQGSKTNAAKLLGLKSYQTLDHMLKRHKLEF